MAAPASKGLLERQTRVWGGKDLFRKKKGGMTKDWTPKATKLESMASLMARPGAPKVETKPPRDLMMKEVETETLAVMPVLQR